MWTVLFQDLAKYHQLAQSMFEGVQTLLEPYHMAVAEGDTDKSAFVCVCMRMCVCVHMVKVVLKGYKTC